MTALARNPISLLALALPLPLLLGACAKSLHQPVQGIEGKFLTYGPPRDTVSCAGLQTQADRDECRRANQRVVEEPYQAVIAIRNLQTREVRRAELDASGAFRVQLVPGEYEVCVRGEQECSDPLTVKMGSFVTYGQRLPRAADSASAPPPKK